MLGPNVEMLVGVGPLNPADKGTGKWEVSNSELEIELKENSLNSHDYFFLTII